MASRKKLNNIKKLPPLTAEAEAYIARAGTGALLNPRFDSTFKAIFTQNTPESKTALRSFLEAATERKITKVTLLPNEAPSDYSDERGLRYDILCDFDDGECANIEMQSFNQEYDYGKRAEYHVARIMGTKYLRGTLWQKVAKAYQISVLDFKYDTTSDEAVSRYAMRTKDGRELTNLLNIVFLELPKLAGKEANLSANSALENWGIFLKEADNPNKIATIKDLAKKEEGIMAAEFVLTYMSGDRLRWARQFQEEMADIDRRSSAAAILEKGMEKGMEKGKLLLAQKFMALGHTKEEAAEFAEIDMKLLD